MRGLGVVVRAWLAHERGESPDARRPDLGPPPHLIAAAWRFRCPGCGLEWTAAPDVDPTAIPHRTRTGWAPPRRCCRACHTWSDGTPVA